MPEWLLNTRGKLLLTQICGHKSQLGSQRSNNREARPHMSTNNAGMHRPWWPCGALPKPATKWQLKREGLAREIRKERAREREQLRLRKRHLSDSGSSLAGVIRVHILLSAHTSWIPAAVEGTLAAPHSDAHVSGVIKLQFLYNIYTVRGIENCTRECGAGWWCEIVAVRAT